MLFTLVFTIEFVLKLLGLGVKNYFLDWFNFFDFGVVVLSWVWIVLDEESAGIAANKAMVGGCRL